MDVIVNGLGFEDKMTGPLRYAYEILLEIDKNKNDYNWYVYIGKNQKIGWQFQKVKYYRSHFDAKYFKYLELILLVNKRRAIHVDYTNGIAIGKKSVVTRHDLFAFHNVMGVNKWKVIKSKIRAYQSAFVAKKIVTVSQFTRNDLIEKCHISDGKIMVIPNAWQHLIGKKIDNSILQKNKLKKYGFFLFVGRLVKNKNIEWIFKEADHNPNDLFVITGEEKNYECFESYKGKLNNIVYTGYVTDEEMASLYSNCKAFLFPSIMEGFGIPPMEALYYGRPIIISNTSSLPEIYGDVAHYINPYKYDYILDVILKDPVAHPEEVLAKYSWADSARQWIKLIKDIGEYK